MGGRATLDLFANGAGEAAGTQAIGPDAWILRGFVADDREILGAIEVIRRSAPFRRMVTPGGRSMSVEMTNCGPAGAPWPQMPPAFLGLARDAAAAAGFPRFEPDACLINCYVPGTRLSLHQDKDERDFDAPIVSVSLGLPAMFLFGSARRAHRPARYLVEHGDVVVWGGASRRYFHGVARIDDGLHARLGRRRINLTFRKAL
jgi:alkylated DNA repair protein (DNA oxidative demethylase)